MSARTQTRLGPLIDVPAALGPYVDTGVLGAADVHVAVRLAQLAGDDRPEVLLAAALAVRAPRRRHVCVDLTTVAARTVAEVVEPTAFGGSLGTATLGAGGFADDSLTIDRLVADLPWPEPDAWRQALETSPLVAVRDPSTLTEPDDAEQDIAPLTLAGDRLYLDRYWRYERRVASDLANRATAAAPVDLQAVVTTIDDLFDAGPVDRQRLAVATAATRYLTVLAGGPGTGKTTTVARLLRVVAAEAHSAGRATPHVALAAPTGKAAARLTESLREAAAALDDDHPDAAWFSTLTATTLHRLLGARGRSTRFRHDRHVPLPHDVVVVDEASMVPLALLAKLLDAVRPTTRLVVVGDPHQLASVEAGSVLADVVGDPRRPLQRSTAVLDTLAAAAGTDHVSQVQTAPAPGIHDAIVVLDRVHRFRADSGLDRFAAAVRDGRTDDALDVLEHAEDLTWIRTDPATPPTDFEAALAPVRAATSAAAADLHAAAAAGHDLEALAHLDTLRVLCAHRRGLDGVAGWVARLEAWAAVDTDLEPDTGWYVGRPVLVTENDRRLELFNGDVGVVVQDGAHRAVAFPGAHGTARRIAPGRLGPVETVHAMSIHKSQGSQVTHAVVVLPQVASAICTRELLYTAVTRARSHVTLVASDQALRTTIDTRTQRASGLRPVLWPDRTARHDDTATVVTNAPGGGARSSSPAVD